MEIMELVADFDALIRWARKGRVGCKTMRCLAICNLPAFGV